MAKKTTRKAPSVSSAKKKTDQKKAAIKPAKPVVAESLSKDELLANNGVLMEIKGKNDEVARLRSAYTASKDVCSRDKKAFDTAVEELQELIRQKTAPHPLFDRDDEQTAPDEQTDLEFEENEGEEF